MRKKRHFLYFCAKNREKLNHTQAKGLLHKQRLYSPSGLSKLNLKQESERKYNTQFKGLIAHFFKHGRNVLRYNNLKNLNYF